MPAEGFLWRLMEHTPGGGGFADAADPWKASVQCGSVPPVKSNVLGSSRVVFPMCSLMPRLMGRKEPPKLTGPSRAQYRRAGHQKWLARC